MKKARAILSLQIAAICLTLIWMGYLTILAVDAEHVAGDGCLYVFNEYEQIHAQITSQTVYSYRPFKSPCLMDRMQSE